MTEPHAALHVLPGSVQVLFLVRIGARVSAIAARPPRFLDGLRAATAALSFAEVLREESRDDELLPWAGNV